MTQNFIIENVSDTALWVAQCRAQETLRPDAVFKDLLAAKLAGSRGREIATSVPYSKMTEWILVIRTVAIDRLIESALVDGVDLVLNLGAGLDTRPYRMHLPKELHWVEVDFPNIINLKNHELKTEKPNCLLERVALDLSQLELRKNFLSELNQKYKKILVLTEGVLPYLKNEEVSQLAKDLFEVKAIHFWIHDYRNGGFVRTTPSSFRRHLKSSPFVFDVDDWFLFFEKYGWVPSQLIKTNEEAERIRRPIPVPFPWNIISQFIPTKISGKIMSRSGYVLMKRSSMDSIQ